MQISAVAPVGVPTMVRTTAPVQPTAVPRMSGPEGLPATDVARRYGTDLLAVPGATGLTWGSREPSVLHIDFEDAASARIAAGLFESSIDDVRLVARFNDQPVEDPGHESAGNAANRVRAVAAMRGVWDARYAETSEYQHGRVTFSTIDRETATRLDSILRDRISLGWMPTGEPRYLGLFWSTPVA